MLKSMPTCSPIGINFNLNLISTTLWLNSIHSNLTYPLTSMEKRNTNTKKQFQPNQCEGLKELLPLKYSTPC